MLSSARIVAASLSLISISLCATAAIAAPREFTFRGQFVERPPVGDACDKFAGQRFSGSYSFDETAAAPGSPSGVYVFPAGVLNLLLGDHIDDVSKQWFYGVNMTISAIRGTDYKVDVSGPALRGTRNWHGTLFTNAGLASDLLPLVPPGLGSPNGFLVKLGANGAEPACEIQGALSALEQCVICQVRDMEINSVTRDWFATLRAQVEVATATLSATANDYLNLVDVLVAARPSARMAVFRGTNGQFTARLGDFAPNQWKAECGPTEAIVGLSISRNDGIGNGALCSASSPRVFGETSRCRAVPFPAGDLPPNSATNPDWDGNFVKASCNAGEYMVGVAQDTTSNRLATMMCCPGNVEPVSQCTTAVVGTADDGSYGDWHPHFPKATCPAGAFARGVSRDGSGRLHALRCCRPEGEMILQATRYRPPLDTARILPFADPGLIIRAPDTPAEWDLFDYMKYTDWDGRRLSAGLNSGTFFSFPSSSLSDGRLDSVLKYKTSDGAKWAAKANGAKFVIAPGGDFSRGLAADAISFAGWDGTAMSARNSNGVAPPNASGTFRPARDGIAVLKVAGFNWVGHLDLYEDKDFGGARLNILDDVPDLTANWLKFNDKTSSLSLLRGYAALYADINYQSRCQTITQGAIANLRGTVIDNDTISSVRMNHSCDMDVNIIVKNTTWTVQTTTLWALGVRKTHKLAKGGNYHIRVPRGALLQYVTGEGSVYPDRVNENGAVDGMGYGWVPTDATRTIYIVYRDKLERQYSYPASRSIDQRKAGFGIGITVSKPWYGVID